MSADPLLSLRAEQRERLSEAEKQIWRDFSRFLSKFGAPRDAYRRVLAHPRSYAWLWYVEGRCGAPPEMWEGDDS